MPLDQLYADSTSDFLTGQNQANVPEPAAPAPSTSLTSIARAAGRGFGQGAANLAGATADTAAGLSQIYSDPDQALLNPSLQEADDQRINKAIALGKAGHLFESSAGTAAYDFASTLKPDPTNSTAIDQVVQGAVAGLTQIVPAAVLGGPLAGAAVGGASIGLGRAEDLKREGVDIGTRTAVGAVEGTLGGLGAVLPVGGSTLARTAALVAVGGPGMAITQGAAEKAILKNANYDHLADQIDPLDPVNLAASTVVAGVFGGAHLAGAKRAAGAADAVKSATPSAAPSVPITEMSVDARKALPFNSSALDAYAQQAAQAAGVPPEMLLFIKNRGERSNSNQVSPAGAKGVMQFTDDTFKAFGKGDPKDPVNSIDAAANYAADLLKRYNGDMRAAITEYNGGVKQAQAVHAGGKPTDPETIAYLKRFDEYAANHQITNATFDPTPAQTDAAFLAHGQRVVDEAHIGPVDDVQSMAMHQDAFELAARQMDNGEPVDVSSVLSGGFNDDVLATYSRLIEKARRADEAAQPFKADQKSIVPERDSLMTAVAKLGGVDRDELVGALGRAAVEMQGGHGIMRAAKRGGMSVDEMAQALHERGYLRSDDPHNELLDKMDEGFNGIDHFTAEAEHANRLRADAEDHYQRLLDQANEVMNRLPEHHKQLVHEEHANGPLSLEEERQLAEHYAQLSEVTGAEREYFGHDAQGRSVAQEGGAHDGGGTAHSDTGARADEPAFSREPGSDDHLEGPAALPVERNLRAEAAEHPDTIVHVDLNAGEQEGRLADILRAIDEEHQNTLQDAGLLSVAADCFISFGE
jgi:soluble lytic murein transglycosylase-like protein